MKFKNKINVFNVPKFIFKRTYKCLKNCFRFDCHKIFQLYQKERRKVFSLLMAIIISLISCLWIDIHPILMGGGVPRGVMVKPMDCGIVEREFVLQSRYYVHFRANTFGKGMNPLILPAMG